MLEYFTVVTDDGIIKIDMNLAGKQSVLDAIHFSRCNTIVSQNTNCHKRTRQEYDRKGLRIPPVEKLRFQCRSFRFAANLSGIDYHIA